MAGAGDDPAQWQTGYKLYHGSSDYFKSNGCGPPIPDPPFITESFTSRYVSEDCTWAYKSTWSLARTMIQLYAYYAPGDHQIEKLATSDSNLTDLLGVAKAVAGSTWADLETCVTEYIRERYVRDFSDETVADDFSFTIREDCAQQAWAEFKTDRWQKVEYETPAGNLKHADRTYKFDSIGGIEGLGNSGNGAEHFDSYVRQLQKTLTDQIDGFHLVGDDYNPMTDRHDTGVETENGYVEYGRQGRNSQTVNLEYFHRPTDGTSRPKEEVKNFQTKYSRGVTPLT